MKNEGARLKNSSLFILLCSLALLVGLGCSALRLPHRISTGWGTPADSPIAGLPDPGQPGPYAVGVTRWTFTRPSTTTGQPRVLNALIWYPASAAATASPPADPRLGAPLDAEPDRRGQPYPVVVFSHGSGGSPLGYTYFATHLASHGFVMVAPPHPGNTSADCPSPCLASVPAARPSILDSALNRPDDVVFALEQAASLSASGDPILAGLLDGDRSGVAGHSFGAWTTLQVVARDHRFRAGLAMATALGPATAQAVSNIQAPVMLMAGALDDLVPLPSIEALYATFGANGPEHWLVALPRGGHLAFSNQCPPNRAGCGPNDLPQERAHALINRWTAAFLLRHVAGDERYAALLDPAPAEGDPEVQVSAAALTRP